MEGTNLNLNIELNEGNKLFIKERSERYLSYDDVKFNRHMLNAYCILLAFIEAEKQR